MAVSPSFVLLVLAGFVAGCVGHAPAVPAPTTLLGTLTSVASYGCDPGRLAVAHEAGGKEVPRDAAYRPCVSKTLWNGREPTLGISAKGTIYYYPAMVGDNASPTGVAVSKDRGASWSLSLPTAAGQSTHPLTLDPYFYLDPTTGRAFADDLLPQCSTLSWSDDEGATWSNSLSGCLEEDHQTIFAGVPVTSTTRGYPNVLYECAINGGLGSGTSTVTTCQRSLDGGLTWLPPGEPAYMTPVGANPCDGAAGHGKTDLKGTVYLPRGFCGVPMLALSHDEGMTWTRLRVSDLGFTPEGHDAGVGVDPAGNVYYFWIAGDRLPYLTMSRDGGTTWSKPLMVAAPGVNEASLPELIVGGVGKLAFVYMGTTNGPGAPFTGDYAKATWNAYIGLTLDALADRPTFYSAAVNDPENDPFVVGTCSAGRCQGVQDFLDIRIGPDGTPWAALVDDCLGPGARCMTSTEQLDTHRVGAVGALMGGPSLWDASDPNGPYP